MLNSLQYIRFQHSYSSGNLHKRLHACSKMLNLQEAISYMSSPLRNFELISGALTWSSFPSCMHSLNLGLFTELFIYYAKYTSSCCRVFSSVLLDS